MNNLSCFISVGEYSGDLLAAELIESFQNHFDSVEAFGVTGKALRSLGVKSVGTIDDLSVMGVFEVIKKLPSILALEQSILREIDRRKPDVAILVDFPGFHFHLAEKLRKRGVKVVQYVAPKLWAWGEHRAYKLARDFDLVLGVFPFEEEFFSKYGVNIKYVGSPHLDRISKVSAHKKDFGFSEKTKVVACLPGSRIDEVKRMMPVMIKLQKSICTKDKSIQFLVPVSKNISFQNILDILMSSQVLKKTDEELRIEGMTFVKGQSLDVMAVADAAVVTSGTATLECALLKTPMAVVYVMNDFSYQLAKKKVKIPWVSLVNILAKKEVVREYIQKFSIKEVSDDILSLTKETESRQKMEREFTKIIDSLDSGAAKKATLAIETLLVEGDLE